jgi:four helix bundle protein
MTQIQNQKKYDLEERTTLFSECIIELYKASSKNIITIPLIEQLIRSGTSIGANYYEANGASSRKDFKNKIYLSKKEAKELSMIFAKIALNTK